MSVIELLQKFRYVTTERQCPISLVRSIDLSKMRMDVPDLQLVKHLTSSLSDCALPKDIQLMTPGEILQLIGAFQAMLQFSLHSQNILRDQMTTKQTMVTAEKISAQHLAGVESKLDLAKKKLDDATIERQALQTTIHALEKQVIELRTANTLLDRELEFHRANQRIISASKSEAAVAPPAPAPAPAPTVAEAEAPRKRGHSRSSHAAVNPYVEDSTTSLDSDAPPVRNSVRRSDSKRKDRSEALGGRYVDWQSFTAFMVAQQQQQTQQLQQQLQLAQQVTSVASPTSASQFRVVPVSATNVVAEPAPTIPPVVATVVAPAPHAQPSSAPSVVPTSQDNTAMILAALKTGLQENRQEILKSTHDVIASVELGLTNKIIRMEEQQRQQHETLAARVGESEKRMDTAMQGIAAQVASVRDESNQQIKLLKLDVQHHQAATASIAVSSASRQTPSLATTAPQSQARSASPSVLPPIPLAQVQQDLSGVQNLSLPNKGGIAGSPVGTPGSVFGPRVVSTTVSNSGDHDDRYANQNHNDGTSDDDDDPYVPISRQNIEEPCQHCRQRFPLVDVRAHEATCELRMTSCTNCQQPVIARLLPNHKCPPTKEPTVASPTGTSTAAATPKSAGDAAAQDTSLNTSNPLPLTRKPSSQMLKDTQDELQRLLEEDAAEEARKASLKK